MKPPIEVRRRFGAALRAARKEAGLNQSLLAHRLGVGSVTTVSDWERGQLSPDQSFRPAMAAALGEHFASLPADGWAPSRPGRVYRAPAPVWTIVVSTPGDDERCRLSPAMERRLEQLRAQSATQRPAALRSSLDAECQVRR